MPLRVHLLQPIQCTALLVIELRRPPSERPRTEDHSILDEVHHLRAERRERQIDLRDDQDDHRLLDELQPGIAVRLLSGRAAATNDTVLNLRRRGEGDPQLDPVLTGEARSAERRVGKEWVSTCRSRGYRYS